MNELISVSELNDERYDVIDKLVIESELKEFFKSVEKIQRTLNKHDIEAKEQYEYLLTLMINQC
jgi:CRISPR/Cas system CMR-associated protein Cmr3 (group 5 of RAMP superfamily)